MTRPPRPYMAAAWLRLQHAVYLAKDDGAGESEKHSGGTPALPPRHWPHCMHAPSWPGQVPIVLDVLVLESTTRRGSEVGTALWKVRRQSTDTHHQTACPVPTPSGPSRGRPALLAQLLAPAFSDFLPLPSARCFRVGKKKRETFRLSCPGLSTSSEAPSPAAEDAGAGGDAGWRKRRKGSRTPPAWCFSLTQLRLRCIALVWWLDASRISMLHCWLCRHHFAIEGRGRTPPPSPAGNRPRRMFLHGPTGLICRDATMRVESRQFPAFGSFTHVSGGEMGQGYDYIMLCGPG